MADEYCDEHSGCLKDISHLQASDKHQWTVIETINSRMNRILGGVCVACILLAINIVITYVKKVGI